MLFEALRKNESLTHLQLRHTGIRTEVRRFLSGCNSPAAVLCRACLRWWRRYRIIRLCASSCWVTIRHARWQLACISFSCSVSRLAMRVPRRWQTSSKCRKRSLSTLLPVVTRSERAFKVLMGSVRAGSRPRVKLTTLSLARNDIKTEGIQAIVRSLLRTPEEQQGLWRAA